METLPINYGQNKSVNGERKSTRDRQRLAPFQCECTLRLNAVKMARNSFEHYGNAIIHTCVFINTISLSLLNYCNFFFHLHLVRFLFVVAVSIRSKASKRWICPNTSLLPLQWLLVFQPKSDSKRRSSTHENVRSYTAYLACLKCT